MARTSPGHLRQTGHDLLGIYLNDHLAGATGGAQLALRAAAAHRGQAVGGAALQQFAGEVGEDRAELIAIMRTLGIALRAYKIYAGWIGERAGRLKLNGHLLSRSPLSSLEELELLLLAVEGKAAGWRTLRTLADSDGRLDAARLDELIARARRQADLLEQLRIQAVERVISPDSASHGK